MSRLDIYIHDHRDASPNLFKIGQQLAAGRKEQREIAQEKHWQVVRHNKSGTTSSVTLPNGSTWGTEQEMKEYAGSLERMNPGKRYEARKMR